MRLKPRVTALVWLALAAACSSKPPAPPPPSADAWAVVNGHEIRRDDVDKAFRRTFDPSLKPTDDEAMSAKLNILNDMIMQDLLLAKAKALSIEVTGSENDTGSTE